MAKHIIVNDVLAACYVCRKPSTVRFLIEHYDVHGGMYAALCDEHRSIAEANWRVIYDASNTEREPGA